MESYSKNYALKILLKGAGFMYLGVILSKLLSYLYRIIIARIGTSEYGLLSLGIAVISMVIYIPLLGMDEGIIRYVSYYIGIKNEQRIKGIITSALKISGILSFVFLFFFLIISKFIANNILNNPSLEIIIKILSFSIPFYVISALYHGIIKAYKKIEYSILIKNIFENLIKVLITYILIILGYGIIGAAIGYTLSIVFSLLLAFVFVETKLIHIVNSKISSITDTKRLLYFSLPLMFHIIIEQIMGWTDTIMIGFFRNISEVGIYNAALPIAHIMTIGSTGMMALFIPIMTDLYAKREKQEFAIIYSNATRWIYYICSYIFIIFIIYGKEILKILFGNDYITGYSSFIILAGGYFVYAIFGASGGILKVIERTKFIMYNTLISTILNVILNYFLIPKYGMVGGAIASTISIIIWSTLNLIKTYTHTKIIPFNQNFIKLIIISIICFGINYFFKFNLTNEIIKVGLGFITIFIIYFSLIIISKSFDKEDITMIKLIKNKLIKKPNIDNNINYFEE